MRKEPKKLFILSQRSQLYAMQYICIWADKQWEYLQSYSFVSIAIHVRLLDDQRLDSAEAVCSSLVIDVAKDGTSCGRKGPF